jgi:hypothetical protein
VAAFSESSHPDVLLRKLASVSERPEAAGHDHLPRLKLEALESFFGK